MRIRRLFIGAKPCNDKQRVLIASWSYVTGYWRWAIWRSPWPSWTLVFGGGYGGPDPTKRYISPGGGFRHPISMHLHIPLLGAFSFGTQPPMESMKQWRAR